MSVRRPLLVILSLCGLLLDAMLLYWKLTDPSLSVVGCGGGGCSEVLASRWSTVFGIPVTAPGLLVYLLLAVALFGRWEGILRFCAAAIGGAALWFVFVQAIFLRQFCPWCMAAHAVGLAVAVLVLVGQRVGIGQQVGVAAAFALALGQLYGPVSATHRITSETRVEEAAPAGVHERGEGRKVSFDQGRKTFNVSTLPRIGSANARHVLIEYHDFQCPSCRRMGKFLRALVDRHPDEVCAVALPVPLDRSCNSHLKPADKGHPGSCELTRIALAAWRVNPGVYQEIHTRFTSDPPPDEETALAFARERVAPASIEEALRDPWIDELIQANISDWLLLTTQNRQLPKLLIRDRRILHGIPPGEEEFIRVVEKELGL